jgi:5-oxoprolinase (ATP-hydrolysing) subunit A
MSARIDLNSDLGESFGPWTMGDDDAMLAIVTSANVACGGHAGDPQTMHRTLRTAANHGVVVGAHPGYADREGFGRRIIPMSHEEVGLLVASQVGSLQAIAALAGTTVRYVKPHGALGNLAADDAGVARAIVQAVRAISPSLAVLAISGTVLEHEARAADQPVYSEVFADRGYLPNGRLVPRSQPDAMIHDVDQAIDRLLRWLETGRMAVVGGEPIALAGHSICVHGDSPGAVDMARAIRERLQARGVAIAPFLAT